MLISSKQLGKGKLNLYLKKFYRSVHKRIEVAQRRREETEAFTNNGIRFIVRILDILDVDKPMLKHDMLDVYLWDIIPKVPTAERLFDSSTSAIKELGHVFSDNAKEEIFLPTSGIVGNVATVLDGWEVWKNIYPIKILAHDSDELATKWFRRINFKRKAPSYMVYGVDVAAIMTKYLVYIREFNIDPEVAPIHKFVDDAIIPGFYADLVDVWMMNQLNHIAKGNKPTKLITDDIYADSEFDKAMDEVTERYNDFIRGKYRLGVLLNTKFFYTSTLTDMVYLQENVFATNGSSRYAGYGMLKMAPIVTFVVEGLMKNRDRGLETAAIQKIVFDSRMLNRLNWNAHVYIDTIEQQVKEMLALIEAADMTLL